MLLRIGDGSLVHEPLDKVAEPTLARLSQFFLVHLKQRSSL